MSTTKVNSEHHQKNVDYLNSPFMPFWRRTAFVYKSQLVFSILFLVCGVAELIMYDCYTIFLLMSVTFFVLILLFLEFYFGSVYNCPALLHLHTMSAALLALACWFSCLIPIFYGEAIYVASRSVTHVIYKFYGVQIITGALMSTFAVASFARRKEIQSVELAHLDYLKRLYKISMSISTEVQNEAKVFNIKPRDVHSIS